MAAVTRHTNRLLSPAESLLFALLPIKALPRRTPTSQFRSKTDTRKARKLPENFSLNAILERDRYGSRADEKEVLDTKTTDEAIPTRWVVVKDTATNQISNPTLLSALLADTDRSLNCVLLLSKDGPQPDTAVVQVISRSELLQQKREHEEKLKELAKAKRAQKQKQIELNWAIAETDLALKLKQFEAFLKKGKSVEVLLANKKRQRVATQQEAEGTLLKVRERAAEMGATEGKGEGKLGQMMTLVYKSAGRVQHEVEDGE